MLSSRSDGIIHEKHTRGQMRKQSDKVYKKEVQTACRKERQKAHMKDTQKANWK